ncbi:MAG TPA: phospholipase C, phosphocholine-specific [Alloacidobacterium sp.]|nr:phospholipase C, phosphocholine-specific [Alloacidobacterium sp.]
MSTDRRTFLKLLSTGAATAAFPASIARALSIPANNRTGTLEDVEHIVFMMQENRSFDHYFGTLRGVRGFGDPRTIKLPSGKSVWYQPDPNNPDGYVLPFHPGAPNLGLQFIQDLAHDWTSTHAAWNAGNYDQWVPQKGTTTMAHLTRSDIPFHYALADAFTVCDAYHCSLLGPTDPNRYHMWTGWVGNDGSGGGPVIDNAELGYGWSTFPELLQKAGVSWKIYQDIGDGLDADDYWGWTSDAYIGNYGDNSLLYFFQYQDAAVGTPLAEKAKTGTNILKTGTLFDIFRQDVMNNNLPQVSWIVAPEAYTEHPNWPANYGAWYVSNMLDALTANPEVWSKTVFFVMFDENDGFFDHMMPPTPPASRTEGISTVPTTNEIFTGSPSYPVSEYPAGPYGLGVRVPMIVISPWSKGGYVNSEVFDHTSLIKFVETRFGKQCPGITESNITPWRRAVTGDMTSAFNFASPNDAVVPLPSTVAYEPPDDNRHPDYIPAVPDDQALPQQEPGTRPARALPYELHVDGGPTATSGIVELRFRNTGKATAVFHVRSGNGLTGPWTYTVGIGDEISDTFGASGNTSYDLSVYGANGYLRTFGGSFAAGSANLTVKTIYDTDSEGIALVIRNNSASAEKVSIADAYSGKTATLSVGPHDTFTSFWQLQKSFGWYDLTLTVSSDKSFQRQLAGHVETGCDSVTDPAIAAAVPQAAVTA